jgi:hypothetical protein
VRNKQIVARPIGDPSSISKVGMAGESPGWVETVESIQVYFWGVTIIVFQE